MDSSEDAEMSFKKNYTSQIIINVLSDIKNGEWGFGEGRKGWKDDNEIHQGLNIQGLGYIVY